MGVIASCCRAGDADENEALLAREQNGYGGDNSEDYNAAQRQMREQEEQMRARENLLKEIVANTNDKLIDISMISNSGIVVQGTDLKNPESQIIRHPSTGSVSENGDGVDNEEGPKSDTKKRFVALDTETDLSEDMKKQLKLLHETIFTTLDEQLRVEPTGKLTVTLK